MMKNLGPQDLRWFVHIHSTHCITELVLQPWASGFNPGVLFPTHLDLSSVTPRAWAPSFWLSPFCTRNPARWPPEATISHPSNLWLDSSDLPTWPSYQHCRKMPKLGAQNCSSFSERVRKMYYMAFPFPSKTIKRSWNMLKKSPGLNFKYTTKFRTLWGLLKVDIFFNPLINIIWNTASFEYLECLPLKNFFEGPPLSCPSKSQVDAGRACVWPNPRVSDPEKDSQLN